MDKKLLKLLLIGFIAGLANGLFGSGGGTIVVPALTYVLDVKDHKAHATAISIILPLTIISTFIYLKGKSIPLDIGYKVAFGGVLGSITGAKLLKKIPTLLLRKIFGSVIVITAIRLLIR